MAALISQVISWPVFLVALLVFGFAPGAVLRLIVLLFRRDDPRRRELIGELYGVPRIERPFWVIEQLEVALFEGLGSRFTQMMPGLRSELVSWRYGWAITMHPAVHSHARRKQLLNLGRVMDLMSDRLGMPAENLLADRRFVDALEYSVAGHFCRKPEPGRPLDLSTFTPIPLLQIQECECSRGRAEARYLAECAARRTTGRAFRAR